MFQGRQSETGTTLTVLMSTVTQLPKPQGYINPSHATKITTDIQSSNAKLATCAFMHMVLLTSSLACLAYHRASHPRQQTTTSSGGWGLANHHMDHR